MLKKLLLISTLLSLSNVAMAEFIFIDRSLDGTRYFYADPSAIIRSKNISKMWNMTSYSEAEKISEWYLLSTKQYVEYNCYEKTAFIISILYYSQPDGGGELLKSYNFTNAGYPSEPIPPDSLGEKLWKIACGKNK